MLASQSGVYAAVRQRAGGTKVAPWMVLYAFDPRTGDRLWRLEGVAATGCLAGGTLVTVRVKPDDPREQHYVVGLDARSGEVKWEHPTDQSGPFAAQPYPTTDGRHVFLFWGDAFVIDPLTGRIVRKELVSGHAPAISGDLLAVPRITETGARQVRAQVDLFGVPGLTRRGMVPDTGYLHPMLFGDYLVTGYGEPSGAVLVYRKREHGYRRTWSARSTTQTGYVADPQRRMLVLYHEWDEATKSGSVVRAYALEDGEPLWSYRPLTVTALGAATRGTLYIPGSREVRKAEEAGGLFAFDSRTGRLLWRYDRPGLRFGAPAISQGRVFVIGSDGSMHAFGSS